MYFYSCITQYGVRRSVIGSPNLGVPAHFDNIAQLHDRSALHVAPKDNSHRSGFGPTIPRCSMGSCLAKSCSPLRLSLTVALNGRERVVSAAALAVRHGLPPRHLEPVLQTLVHHGVLPGVRGPHGGYTLARERQRL
jgi:Iron-dependent Transcriptional regulator